MDSEATPNQRLTADQFNNLQINAPTIMEDRGMDGADRLMILHLQPVVDMDGHADLDADFSELDERTEIDFRFEACGHCLDLGMQKIFEKTVEQLGEMPTFPEDGDDK